MKALTEGEMRPVHGQAKFPHNFSPPFSEIVLGFTNVKLLVKSGNGGNLLNLDVIEKGRYRTQSNNSYTFSLIEDEVHDQTNHARFGLKIFIMS